MPANKTKTAARKAARKQATSKRAAEKKTAPPPKAPTRASANKAANAKPAPAKVPKKKAAKKSTPEKKPGLGKTVNMGPLRGNNSWPPGNRKLANNSSRAPGSAPDGSPAKDSATGPGGKTLEGRGKDKKKGGAGSKS